MTDDAPEHADERPLRLVHDDQAGGEAEPSDDDASTGAHDGDTGGDEPRDPLLARAERIADLPLAERPAAFDGLNRAVVAELNTLEEG
jgi:hypothetical protein